jgi:hypothetical protein
MCVCRHTHTLNILQKSQEYKFTSQTFIIHTYIYTLVHTYRNLRIPRSLVKLSYIHTYTQESQDSKVTGQTFIHTYIHTYIHTGISGFQGHWSNFHSSCGGVLRGEPFALVVMHVCMYVCLYTWVYDTCVDRCS